MQANAEALKLNELEWRSDAVQASAGQIISEISRQSKLHWGVLRDLGGMSEKMLDLLQYLHSSEAIAAIESTDSERLQEIADKMYGVQGKVRIMIAQIHSWDLGFWRRFYVARIEKLKVYNAALLAHADAFRDNPVVLSKRDQDFVVASLLAPAEPNDALRRIFTQH